MSLRTMISHPGKENRKLQYISMKNLYELICTKGRGFLLPPSHAGCTEHNWKQLDSGFCVCEWCGKEHHCFRGECPEEIAYNYDRVCTITGCVTTTREQSVIQKISLQSLGQKKKFSQTIAEV